MIKNKWYVILESKEIKKGKILKVKRFGMDIILWRKNDGTISAIESRCPHRGADLSQGKIVDDCVQCPYHGILFDGNGNAKLIPSMGKAAKISEGYKARNILVKEFNGLVFMWYGEKYNGEEIKWFEDLDDSFSYSSFKSVWKVNYTRAIENQLDVSHLPFVHRTTIGRGGRTLVNGPLVRFENDVMDIFTCNSVDRGQKPLSQKDLKLEDCRNKLEFIIPNYWLNSISEKIKVFAAFVPVDDEETLIYIRQYQKFTNIPVIRNIINYIFIQFDKIVLNQDRRVVETQIPKEGKMSNKELLLPADYPILLYRQYLAKTDKSGE